MPGQKAPEEQRRREILDAAFAVAVRDGLDALTVRKVAVEAGLSPGLVFFHFATKDALLVALLERLRDWLLDVGEPPAAPPAERLVALLGGETRAAGRDRAELSLLLQYWVLAARRPDLRPVLLAVLDRYRGLVAATAGEVAAAAGVPPGPLAALATSLVLGGALQGLVDPDFDPGPSLDALAALLSPAR